MQENTLDPKSYTVYWMDVATVTFPINFSILGAVLLFLWSQSYHRGWGDTLLANNLQVDTK